MFKKVDIVDNVNTSIVLTQNDLKYSVKDSVFLNNTKIETVNGDIAKIVKDINYTFIEYFSNDDGMERTTILSNNTLKINTEQNNLPFMIREIKGNYGVILTYDEDYNTVLEIIELKAFKSVWKGDINPFGFELIDEQYILVWNKEGFRIVDFKNNLEKFYKSYESIECYLNSKRRLVVEKKIGLINESQFIIVLEGGVLVLLSLEEFKILNVIDLTSLWNDSNIVFGSIHLDSKKKVVKFFGGLGYFELDITTEKISRSFLFEGNNNWWITRSNDYGKYMTFVGSKDEVTTFPNSFGVFDCEEGKVAWYDGISKEEREEKGFFSTPPLLSEETLAVVSSNKELYIYKKQKD